MATTMQTRREALASINVESIEQRVFACIDEHGRTDEELADALDMKLTTAQARRVSLLHAGLIRSSGQTRPLASGRQGIVWEAVPEHEFVRPIEEVRFSARDKAQALIELRKMTRTLWPTGGIPPEIDKLGLWLAYKVKTNALREEDEDA